MARYHVEIVIFLLKGGKDSIADIVSVAHAMAKENIGPSHQGLKEKKLEDRLSVSLEFEPGTVLEHLMDLGLVEKEPEEFEDLRTYAIAAWKGTDGEIVNGNVDGAANEGIEALIDHMQDTDADTSGTPAIADGGTTIRSVLSDHFGVEDDDVESRLRSGDPVDTLNGAVEGIQEEPAISTRGDYGEIVFRFGAYRYRLTAEAVQLYNR